MLLRTQHTQLLKTKRIFHHCFISLTKGEVLEGRGPGGDIKKYTYPASRGKSFQATVAVCGQEEGTCEKGRRGRGGTMDREEWPFCSCRVNWICHLGVCGCSLGTYTVRACRLAPVNLVPTEPGNSRPESSIDRCTLQAGLRPGPGDWTGGVTKRIIPRHEGWTTQRQVSCRAGMGSVQSASLGDSQGEGGDTGTFSNQSPPTFSAPYSEVHSLSFAGLPGWPSWFWASVGVQAGVRLPAASAADMTGHLCPLQSRPLLGPAGSGFWEGCRVLLLGLSPQKGERTEGQPGAPVELEQAGPEPCLLATVLAPQWATS